VRVHRWSENVLNGDSPVLIVIKRESVCVTEVLINPIIRTRTRNFRDAFQITRDNICPRYFL
jgi:hypothetical protein